MNQTITIDRMPVHAWSRPKVNEIEIALNPVRRKTDKHTLVIEGSEGFVISQKLPEPKFKKRGADYFVPEKLDAFVVQNAHRRYHIRIPKGHHALVPLSLTFRLNDVDSALIEELYIEAEENTKATVIVKYYGQEGMPVEHTGITRIKLSQGSELHLIKLQMLNQQALHHDAVEAIVEKEASLSVMMAELGAGVANASCNVQLDGEEADLKLDVLYLGDGARQLDMTYRAEHRGKKTVSAIRARGILHGTCRKVLRDTLEFISGAAGSKGREEESVLLLGSKARNISVPLLLCGEHDVEGEHAATSGRLDEEMMFYIMSRGISQMEGRKMMAKAAFGEILEQIPDEAMREEIMAAVDESIDKGGADEHVPE